MKLNLLFFFYPSTEFRSEIINFVGLLSCIVAVQLNEFQHSEFIDLLFNLFFLNECFGTLRVTC